MVRRSQRFVLGLSMAIVVAFCESASAQTIDESYRADIEQLLEVTGAKDIGLQMGAMVSQQMLDAMQKSRPDIPPRVVQIIREVVDQHFSRSMTGPDSMLGGLVAVYAKYFTQAEVRGLVAFYRSDLGRKAIAGMPGILKDSAALGQEWNSRHMPEVIAELEKRLRAEGF